MYNEFSKTKLIKTTVYNDKSGVRKVTLEDVYKLLKKYPFNYFIIIIKHFIYL